MKRGGGRRYYRPDDVELLRGIRHLLYDEGYTIKGVQRILREQGIKFVMAVWHEGAPGLADIAPPSEAAAPPPKPAKRAPPEPAPEPDDEPAAATSHDPLADLEDLDLPVPRDVQVGDAPAKGEGASRMPFRLIGRLRGETDHDGADHGTGGLSRDDVRRLQATLFELLEIKRLLDQAR